MAEIDTEAIIEGVEAANRKMASIQRIVAISPIPGADRVEVAQCLGWECVISKKDNFKVGDLVIFFEVDSILPQKPEFEFLRERKFRVKTIKLRKQISSGLIMPLSILPSDVKIEEGLDVSAIIGVLKHDPEGRLEAAMVEHEKRSPLMKFLMGISAFRYVYLKLNEKKGPWPAWIGRTDETRIQVCAKYMMEHYDEEWEITEKLDGQSATYFVHPMKVWGVKRSQFGCCSRKIWLKTPTESRYWGVARHYGIEESLRCERFGLGTIIENIFIQSENCGPGIQANKYKLAEVTPYIFNLVSNGVRQPYATLKSFCRQHKLNAVPLVMETFVPKRTIGENKTVMEVVNYMVQLSQGKSQLLDRPREGIVCRLKSNPEISLKVINPYFKMEQEAEEDVAETEET